MTARSARILRSTSTPRLPQPGDEPAVAHAVDPGAGVDALDPELPEVTLASPTVAVGVLQRVHDLLMGGTVAAALVAEVTLGLFENGAVMLLAWTARFTRAIESSFQASS